MVFLDVSLIGASSAQAALPLREKSLPTTLRRYDSDLNNHEDQENQSSFSNNGVEKVAVKSPSHEGGYFKSLGENRCARQNSGDFVISVVVRVGVAVRDAREEPKGDEKDDV
ncbi:hypothetical protein Fmac_021064 [Flemingia macrophylla]|uniref:Uncharacterized protein n=1 Tax=Flemingia macrophylla TaxID=520843 RepID=A0ABD1LVS8_9FABA